MVSDATVLYKAIILSLLLHLLILVLLGSLMPRRAPVPDFPVLRVSLKAFSAPSVVQAEALAALQAPDVVERPDEAPVELPAAPELPEAPVSTVDVADEKTETPPAQSIPSFEPSEAAAVPPVFAETVPAESAAPESPAVSDSASEPEPTGASGRSDNPVSEAPTAGAVASVEPAGPDISWEGSAPRLRTVPEPLFSLPYGGNLFDTVLIRFTVESDGTVGSIKVLPPGSGYPDVDRQIRSYVASFLFEEFSGDGAGRRGELKLRLKARENGGL